METGNLLKYRKKREKLSPLGNVYEDWQSFQMREGDRERGYRETERDRQTDRKADSQTDLLTGNFLSVDLSGDCQCFEMM